MDATSSWCGKLFVLGSFGKHSHYTCIFLLFLIRCCGTNLFKKTGNKAEPKISFVILGGALSFIMYSLSKEMPCKLLGLVVLKGANGGLCHLEYLGPFLQNY